MKNNFFLLTLLAIAGATLPLQATTYNDATGEGSIVTSFPFLDITSVEVNNNATDLIFKINLAGNPVATDWGKYMIGIDSVVGGDPVGNGWGRPIGMVSGMDYWVGSWVDSGNGSEIRNWTGAAWNLQSATYNPNPDGLTISKDASSVTVGFKFAGLGLAPGSTFLFDVYSSGGGGSDSAIDALANPAQTVANWSDPYNSGALVASYTLTPIPEPAAFALLGMGGLLMIQRAFRRRA